MSTLSNGCDVFVFSYQALDSFLSDLFQASLVWDALSTRKKNPKEPTTFSPGLADTSHRLNDDDCVVGFLRVLRPFQSWGGDGQRLPLQTASVLDRHTAINTRHSSIAASTRALQRRPDDH